MCNPFDEDAHSHDRQYTNTHQHVSDGSIRSGDGEQSVTVTIADALAASEYSDKSPLEFRPLYEYIDPDALEMLIQSTSPATNLYVEFEVYGKTISVHGDGRVVVDS